ncbi:hypothetical protein Pcinc_020118 [Petrolisthes cinctipes]|uniref:CUB domain-containing protein n=1 Tax=Petrolisthes cinctipes TaxID=88211 RepID=A0AAE1FKT1_PETCI|nr:hypothetical protein Pcinc_020118 [Petrolisthes cinctipes]
MLSRVDTCFDTAPCREERNEEKQVVVMVETATMRRWMVPRSTRFPCLCLLCWVLLLLLTLTSSHAQNVHSHTPTPPAGIITTHPTTTTTTTTRSTIITKHDTPITTTTTSNTSTKTTHNNTSTTTSTTQATSHTIDTPFLPNHPTSPHPIEVRGEEGFVERGKRRRKGKQEEGEKERLLESGKLRRKERGDEWEGQGRREEQWHGKEGNWKGREGEWVRRNILKEKEWVGKQGKWVGKEEKRVGKEKWVGKEEKWVGKEEKLVGKEKWVGKGENWIGSEGQWTERNQENWKNAGGEVGERRRDHRRIHEANIVLPLSSTTSNSRPPFHLNPSVHTSNMDGWTIISHRSTPSSNSPPPRFHPNNPFVHKSNMDGWRVVSHRSSSSSFSPTTFPSFSTSISTSTTTSILRPQLPPSTTTTHPPPVPTSGQLPQLLKTQLPLSKTLLPPSISDVNLPQSSSTQPPQSNTRQSTSQLQQFRHELLLPPPPSQPLSSSPLPPATTTHHLPQSMNQLSPSTNMHQPTFRLPQFTSRLPTFYDNNHNHNKHQLSPSTQPLPSTTTNPQHDKITTTTNHHPYLPLFYNQFSPSSSPPTSSSLPGPTTTTSHQHQQVPTNYHRLYLHPPTTLKSTTTTTTTTTNEAGGDRSYHNPSPPTSTTTIRSPPTTISEDPTVLQPPPLRELLGYHNHHASTPRQPKWFTVTGLLRGVLYGVSGGGGLVGGACRGEDGREGVCEWPGRCTRRGGTPSYRPCSLGYRYTTCCVARTRGCHAVSRVNNTYWESDPEIQEQQEEEGGVRATTCTLTIHKLSPDICTIRLDLLRFQLAPPVSGRCVVDHMVVTGQNLNSVVPRICGNNTGQHLYVGVESVTGPVEVTITTLGGAVEGLVRAWELAVAQIECGSVMKPPPGCLQYLTSHRSTFSSFNYNPHINATYMNNLNYAVCIRKEVNSCTLTYTSEPQDDMAFDIVNFKEENGEVVSVVREGEAGVGLIQCPGDYLVLAGTRLCGQRFNDASQEPQRTNHGIVTEQTNGPFIVQFGSDEQYVGRGFQLSYQQYPC